nr:MAG TPA: minor tail protein [Caudoviricetes sp.]
MTEELRIKVVADTSEFDGQMDKTGKKIDETSSKAEKSESKWASFGRKMAALSPTFAKAQKGIGEQSSKMEGAFGKSIGAAKLMKLGVIGAVAAIAVKVGQIAWKVGKETARMFDPKGYSQAAGKMQKSIKRLKTTIGSFTAPLVNGIMKVVSAVADGLNWVLEKIRIVRSFIWGVVKGVITPIIDGIKQVISWIQQGINMLSNLLGFGDVFKKPSESAKNAADSMGEVVEATSAGLAGFDKLNTLDMSNSGDAEQAEKLSESMEKASKFGEEIGKKLNIKGIVEEIMKIPFGDIWGKFKSKAGDAWRAIKGFGTDAWGRISQFGGDMWAGIKKTGGDVWSGIETFGGDAWAAISGFGGDMWAGIKKTGEGIWTTISGFGESAWSSIKGFGTDAWRKISKVGGTAWQKFLDLGNDLKKLVVDKLTSGFEFIKGIVEKIEKIIDKIVDKAKGITDGVVGGVTSFVKDPVGGIKSLPGKAVSKFKDLIGFADGGVVKPNNPFPVIVGDNTKELEVISPMSTIRQAVKEAIQSAGAGNGASSGPIELTINLDSRKIARAVYDPLQTESRRRGSRA